MWRCKYTFVFSLVLSGGQNFPATFSVPLQSVQFRKYGRWYGCYHFLFKTSQNDECQFAYSNLGLKLSSGYWTRFQSQAHKTTIKGLFKRLYCCNGNLRSQENEIECWLRILGYPLQQETREGGKVLIQ